MTENRNLNNENIDRDNRETLEADRRDGISTDQQWGTGHNEGQIHHNDMEDQLREDVGIEGNTPIDSQHDSLQDGHPEEELQEDIGLRDGDTDREVVDRD